MKGIFPRLVFVGAMGFMLCLIVVTIAGVVAPNEVAALSGQWMGIPLKQTRAITGDARRFTPMAGLVESRAFAGADAKLVSMRAEYVRADGTMDLTATYSPSPQTEY